ncbi:glycoside hydrolase [Obba rivulosa]|uniref:Glycoside hydrolase n=1 Tax=Obba rivulosa TaxID=1052685 RepID=A0A8E2AHR4_9APHY|nr:glycoside hydrolase [Obba rivulosa]
MSLTFYSKTSVMHLLSLVFLLILVVLSPAQASYSGSSQLGKSPQPHHRELVSRSTSDCQELSSVFATGDISTTSDTSFVAISPVGSYSTGPGGLELFLERPSGKITTKDGVNDKVATGATVNSTFTILYGRVTFYVSGPLVPGIVTAAILVGDSHDEIDIELLGGDSTHWQTNVFAPSPRDHGTIYGVFSGLEDYAHGNAEDPHAYTIDWSPQRIAWSVDGREVRALTPDQTLKNSARHYPVRPMRIQLGIWDASSPQGTAAWAKGPVDWTKAPHKTSAMFKNVTVDCPYVRKRKAV